MVLEDSTAENPLYLFVVIILQTLYEYTACLDILHSVGKFTVVYKVHIYYTMATILDACVLLSLLCASAACLVILGNDIITLLKIHFGV